MNVMIQRKVLALFTLCFLASFTGKIPAPQTSRPAAYVPPEYSTLPLGAIRPTGWLRDQLMTMRRGSTGHLDETYAKIRNDNGWLGGKGDGWEETPYWLDGALPLAYLLNDKELQAKVLKYVNWTIDHQRPSGYFGPVTKWERETGKQITVETSDKGEDWWPKMVMLKVVRQYYEATNDKRAIDFMAKYFDYQLKALPKSPIKKWTEWAESRGADNVMVIQWLYGKNKDPKLLQLASLIQSQSYPWSTWLGNRDWVIDAAANQNEKDWMHRHGVNVAMGLKDPVINYQRTHNPKFLKEMKTGFNDLMNLHGLPMGMFSADEDLHGNHPEHGTELCAIVESMFSLEKAIEITGDTQYMDALERMTFNALPTQTTDDYNKKQYFQIANQVQISRGVFDFSLPFDRGMNNVLGARSGYTCCLANMHQGWTKFTQHLWYASSQNGLAALAYSPNILKTTVGKNNTAITIEEQTDYPFSDEIIFAFGMKNTVEFPFTLRIPGWCKTATISLNGKKLRDANSGELVKLSRSWKNGDKISLKLPMAVSTSNWAENSRAIERGPLVYALKLDEKWETGSDAKEGAYFSVFPKGDWNYGLEKKQVDNPELITVKEKPLKEQFVWNMANAPIELTASARKIPDWKVTNGVAYLAVTGRSEVYKGEVNDQTEKVTLIPYGFTKVRIVAFPVVPDKNQGF